MVTESSAIARLVSSAHAQAIDDPLAHAADQHPPASSPATPDPSVSREREQPRSGFAGAVLVVVLGILVIGGAVAGGYFLAKHQKLGASEKSALQTRPVEPSGDSTQFATAPIEKEEEPTIEPDTEVGVSASVDLARQTGFDVIVDPMGAKVSLDGHDIGSAPLRVRNLLPGVHRLGIEGPAGFFGRHIEFELKDGEAQVIELALEPVGGEAAVLDEPAKEPVDEVAIVQNNDPDLPSARKSSRKKRSKDRSPTVERETQDSRRAANEKTLETAGKVSLGTLMLGSKPPCRITIDGKDTGLMTPQRSIQLPEGTYRVVLLSDEHGLKKSFNVNIKAGRTTRAIQDLTEKL